MDVVKKKVYLKRIGVEFFCKNKLYTTIFYHFMSYICHIRHIYDMILKNGHVVDKRYIRHE